MKSPKFLRHLFIVLFVASLGAASAKAKEAYYTVDPVFSPYPHPKKNWKIRNFGPVGIGIMLEKGMVAKINNVEEDSPADKTGQLQKGQIIESINGVKFEDRDPRLILGDLITDAEASDGKINLKIQGKGIVTVTIPVMGAYSPSWPLNCPKSDKIVRNLADLIAKQGKNEWGSVLFLLSTGEEKDLDVVRGWMKDLDLVGGMNWDIGYKGMGVCEYYLRTGDESVLPAIQKGADHLRDHIYNGGWAGRATGKYVYQSGGHVNASGIHCLTFLLLAKTCGVDVDDYTLAASLRHFYRFSGRGIVPYGDYTPKAGFGGCNGKTSGLALAMAAASRLTPGGDNSIYSRAAQINAMKSFYGINVFNVGHTGGGIGEIWKSASMALVVDERPNQYRAYMDARRWILELSRRHTGGIGVGGGHEGNYDQATGEGGKGIAWGTYYGLSYTLPRKHLHLFGAPRSKWAKSFTLPERPWGTAADDDFSDPYPPASGPWRREDVLKEHPSTHAEKPVLELLNDPKVSNRDIVTYLHHPEITFRTYASEAVLRLEKDDMVLGLLKSRDARLRHRGVMALHDLLGTWRPRDADPNRVTPAMWEQVERIIRDPHESWFVKQWALTLLQHTDLEHLRTFRDLLATLVQHEEHWIQGAAISASQGLLSDPESYKILFPPIVDAISAATEYPVVTRAHEITKELKDASPEIREYALNMLKPVFTELPNEMVSERGISVVSGGGAVKRASIGKVVGFSEEGEAFLNSMPKVTSAWKVSGREADKYVFNGKFESNPDLVGRWDMVSHTKLKNKQEALEFIKQKLATNDVPPLEARTNYGFQVDGGSDTIKVLGYHRDKYGSGLRYSGNTAFKTFVDKAYKFEIFTVEGRKYLLIENDFDFERDEDYVPVYKSFVQVADKK